MRTINRQYIDGVFVESHGREVLDTTNPSTGEVLGRVTLADEEDTRRAIAAAKAAFRVQSQTTKSDRSEQLRSLRDAVAARAEDLLAAMVDEYGAPLKVGRWLVERAVSFLAEIDADLTDVELTTTIGNSTIVREPLGVAALITPWNTHTLAVCMKLGSAIAGGCTAVVKPSELSALQNDVLIECFHAAALPRGVINVVVGRGDVVGAELVRHRDIAKISFTGSTAVGKRIVAESAATMKRLTLELGGKSPNIILDDADFEVEVPNALDLAFRNNGQSCLAGTRLLVPESRLSEVKTLIADAITRFHVGDPRDARTVIGPLISQRQYERVQRYIRQGLDEGAELLVGGLGHPPGLERGHYVKPTVFTNVQRTMSIAREEIFGPVLCVLTYTTDEDAIELANDSDYGLYAYMSGKDIKRLDYIASRVVAGRISINGAHSGRLPFGGFKHSGLGREGSIYGIEEFTEPKAVSRP